MRLNPCVINYSIYTFLISFYNVLICARVRVCVCIRSPMYRMFRQLSTLNITSRLCVCVYVSAEHNLLQFFFFGRSAAFVVVVAVISLRYEFGFIINYTLYSVYICWVSLSWCSHFRSQRNNVYAF